LSLPDIKQGSIKWLSLFLGFFLFDGTRAAGRLVPGQKHGGKTMQRALSVRGQIKSKNLAELLSTLAAGDAVAGFLAPVSYMKWFGADNEKGSLSEHFLHAISSSAPATAISTSLAVSWTTSVEETIGYGFVSLLSSNAVMIITKTYHELGMTNIMLGAVWAILVVATHALLSGKWEPLALL
jgi:hypothetical protein